MDYLIASSTKWANWLLTKGGSDTFPILLSENPLIIMSCWKHGYSWPSLATFPYPSSPQAGLLDNILYPHTVAECMFVLVVLLLHGHVWGSIRVQHLWVRPWFLFLVFSPMIFHIFSNGFIAGLCGGHFITAIPSSSRKLNSFSFVARCIVLHKFYSFSCPFVLIRKSMLAKKFFINTGINITMKTNNGSCSRWRNQPLCHYAPPSKFHSFLNALRR